VAELKGFSKTSLTQAYINLLPDRTTASMPAVTTLRCIISMYVLFVCNKLCSRIVCFVNSSAEITFRIDLAISDCSYINKQ
jgi:hypothetical protein